MKRERRVVALFTIMMCGLMAGLLGVAGASFHGEELAQAAARQSSYELTVTRSRGDFYDCTGQKLTSRSQKTLAAVAPTIEAAAAMNQITHGEYRETVGAALSNGTPFLATAPFGTESSNGIDVFTIPQRYEEEQLASNLIGYVDGSGTGAAGLERAFDSVLNQEGSLTITYSVDAVNRVMDASSREISDTRQEAELGVVLTLDRRIQQVAEDACRDVLEKGAVVVMDVQTGEIRALVSLPSLHPNDLAADMENEDSPLINKAFSAYSAGSIFKLVSAAAALESGLSPDYTYTCTGSIQVQGQGFKCFNGISHGTVAMEDAIAQSCNGYFVSLMQQVPQMDFLAMAKSLGFGVSCMFAEGLSSDSGVLPSEKSLASLKALANFSFGQGELTVTPVQVAAMTAAIANGGTYREPSLVTGIQNLETGVYEWMQPTGSEKRTISEENAALLRSFMEKAAKEGTAASGQPETVKVGAKTGTAQTGQYSGDIELVHLWYTGYFPAESPKYAVTVLRADSDANTKECAQVFRTIAQELESQGFLG